MDSEVVDQTGVGFVFRVVTDMRLTRDWRRIPPGGTRLPYSAHGLDTVTPSPTASVLGFLPTQLVAQSTFRTS